jgi:hypothetical protein
MLQAVPTRPAADGEADAGGSLALSEQTSSQVGETPPAPREPPGPPGRAGWSVCGPVLGGCAADAPGGTAAQHETPGFREPFLECDAPPGHTADCGLDETCGATHAHPAEGNSPEAPTPPATPPPDMPAWPAASPAEHGEWETAGCARGRRQRWKGAQLPAGLFTGAMRAPGGDTDKIGESTSVLSDRTATIHEDEWASSSVSSQDPEAARSIAQAGKGLHGAPVARPAAPTPTQQVAAGSAFSRRRTAPKPLFPARTTSSAPGVPAAALAAPQPVRMLKPKAPALGSGRLAWSVVTTRALTCLGATRKAVAQVRLATVGRGMSMVMPPPAAPWATALMLLFFACLVALGPIAGLSKPRTADVAAWAAINLITWVAPGVGARLVRACPSASTLPTLSRAAPPRAQSRLPCEHGPCQPELLCAMALHVWRAAADSGTAMTHTAWP